MPVINNSTVNWTLYCCAKFKHRVCFQERHGPPRIGMSLSASGGPDILSAP